MTIDEGKTLVKSMLAIEIPIVGAVNGPAVGLGCSLASLCDLVLIAEDAYLSDPHVVLGLVAADGGAISWPYLTGLLRAKEHLFLGTRISAAEAVAAGLATRVSADPLTEAVELAHKLAELPPQSVRETKRLLNAGLRNAVATLHRRRHGRRVAVVRHARVPGQPGPATRQVLKPSFEISSDRRNAVEPVAERAVLASGEREPGDQVGAEVFGFDDRVDHQLRRQPQQVDVGGELGASLVDELARAPRDRRWPRSCWRTPR